jgi:hypothetical protein
VLRVRGTRMDRHAATTGNDNEDRLPVAPGVFWLVKAAARPRLRPTIDLLDLHIHDDFRSRL